MKRINFMVEKYYIYIFFLLIYLVFTGCLSTKPQIKTIQTLNSYQTSLTERDIASFFKNAANRYLSQSKYYSIDYTVYYEKDGQNFAWMSEIERATFRWGELYIISLHTNNGVFQLMTTSVSRDFTGSGIKEIITFRRGTVGWVSICEHINQNILAFFNEMGIAAKQNNLYIRNSVSEAFSELNMLD